MACGPTGLMVGVGGRPSAQRDHPLMKQAILTLRCCSSEKRSCGQALLKPKGPFHTSDLAGWVLGTQCPPKPQLNASKSAECSPSRLHCFASPLISCSLRAATTVSGRGAGFEFMSRHVLVLGTPEQDSVWKVGMGLDCVMEAGLGGPRREQRVQRPGSLVQCSWRRGWGWRLKRWG